MLVGVHPRLVGLGLGALDRAAGLLLRGRGPALGVGLGGGELLLAGLDVGVGAFLGCALRGRRLIGDPLVGVLLQALGFARQLLLGGGDAVALSVSRS